MALFEGVGFSIPRLFWRKRPDAKYWVSPTVPPYSTNGRDRSVAAAIDADFAGVVEGVRPGLNVQHACRTLAKLRRQRAGQERQAADDAGVEDLPEGSDAVGEHDAVDAILNIGVLVADM